MAQRGRRSNVVTAPQEAEAYRHPEADSPSRPDVGTQPQFRKKKPPVTYRYDSSLAPALDWDGQSPARDFGEWLLQLIEAASALPPPHIFDKPQEFNRTDGKIVATIRSLQEAVDQLRRTGKPFLNWAGKAERVSFDVPTLPLFVHERLSTKGIIETLSGHRRNNGGQQLTLMDLFGDPQHSVTDQVLKAYEYRDKWVNRLILGDSLVVMNSLLHYEGLDGQVQMIYMDPPYGVKFGSNFQPFVRKRNVDHNDDEDMTREPEMVKAYRDTWELGLHSYLTYLRDRLLLCRDLLHPSGSIIVQISDENLHHVREIMEEVFGADNFIAVIPFRKKTMPLGAKYLESMNDFLLWYARDGERLKYTQLFQEQSVEGDFHWSWYELPDGSRYKMTKDQQMSYSLLPDGAKPFRLVSMWPPTYNANAVFPVQFRGREWLPPPGQCWPSGPEAMQRLVNANRLEVEGQYLRYVLYLSDYNMKKITANWDDTTGARDQLYVVQTSTEVVKRCLLMTTDPGDLVLDPTCGSGTTAYIAEYWGRRWITIDISRVPLALARQRLLTATYPYYRLKDESRGPAGGFDYKPEGESQNPKSVGPGIVPHITL